MAMQVRGDRAPSAPARMNSTLRLPAATRVLDNPTHQLPETHTGVASQLGHERSARHARLGIHLEANQTTTSIGSVVVAEVGARYAATAESLVGQQRVFPYGLVNIR